MSEEVAIDFVEPRTLYTGYCVGGPLDQTFQASRYPRGFILMLSSDGPNSENKAGIYKYDPNSGKFFWGWSPNEADQTVSFLVPFDEEKAWQTAEGDEYDIRSF